jgi:hypothetical protein
VESFSLAPRIIASMSPLRFLALTIVLASLPASAMSQPTPQATPATVQPSASLPGLATDAASCSISVAGLLPGALRAHSATLSADGTRAVICSDRRVILVSTSDCTLLAQADHPISIVESVLLTRAGRVVVVGAGGAWSWDPAADTSRTILTGYVSMALHVGGEAVVVASEDAEGVLLRRFDARTGRTTHRRLIPGGRQIYGLGFGARGTLLVLTPSGVFGTNATLGRVTQPPLSFSNSYGERREIALTVEGQLPYEELLQRRIFIAALSPGRAEFAGNVCTQRSARALDELEVWHRASPFCERAFCVVRPADVCRRAHGTRTVLRAQSDQRGSRALLGARPLGRGQFSEGEAPSRSPC